MGNPGPRAWVRNIGDTGKRDSQRVLKDAYMTMSLPTVFTRLFFGLIHKSIADFFRYGIIAPLSIVQKTCPQPQFKAMKTRRLHC